MKITVPRMRRRTPSSVSVPSPFADDRLDGAGQIADFWFGSNTYENRRRIFRWAQDGAPVGKLNGRLIASKRVLTELYQQLTELEPPPELKPEPEPEPAAVLRRRA